jgi:hypothetical protein
MLYFLPGDLLGLCRPIIQYVLVNIRQGDTLYFRITKERFQVFESHAVTSDKPDAYLIVCAHTSAPGFNEKRTDGKSGTEQSGLPEKISSSCHGITIDLKYLQY